MSIRTFAAAVACAAALALAAGCASPAAPDSGTVRPGDTFSFDGAEFQLRQVQEDFVLLRFRSPDDEDSPISGFVDEVFRVSRYELGQGRWYASPRLPGVYVQWLGLDAFALAHDRSALAGAEVVMLR